MTWKLNRSRKGPWVLLIGPKDDGFIAELKNIVPMEFRQWQPSMQAWRIDDRWADKVQELIDSYG